MPDAAYLVNGVKKKRFAEPKGINAALWYEIGKLWQKYEGAITVRKTKAHIDEKTFCSEPSLCEEDFIGNFLADRLVARGAAERKVTDAQVCVANSIRGRTVNILKRMVAVQKLFVERHGVAEEGMRPDRLPRSLTIVQAAVRDTKHSLEVCPTAARFVKQLPHRVECVECGSSVSRDGAVVSWLRSECSRPEMCPSALTPELEKPKKLVRVGRSDLHSSHNLRVFKGLFFCVRCGAYATASGCVQKESPKFLCKECSGVKTRATEGYIRRLARGLPPRTDMSWPPLQAIREDALHNIVPRTRLRCKTSLDELGYSDSENPHVPLSEHEEVNLEVPPLDYDDENPFDFPLDFDT